MVHTPIHIIHPRIIDMKVKMHAYSSKLYSHIHHRTSIFTTIWTVRGKSFVSRASCGFRIFFRRSRSKGWGSVSSWGDSLTLSTATTTRSHTAPSGHSCGSASAPTSNPVWGSKTWPDLIREIQQLVMDSAMPE
jgi:hypothetical protein